jgi:hypothetical protein
MTIYSQHANRGKIQILATYNGNANVISCTVTSVDDATAAAAIVDALNRISASACVPISVRDERFEVYARYPSSHLAVITEPSRRADLLTGRGEHSLWYEYAMLALHQALADLDTAIAAMPSPVRTAITAELEAEARALRVGLYEYEGGPAQEETGRQWDFEDPFVLFNGGMVELSHSMRERLDSLERNLSTEQLAEATEDLRVLYNTYITAGGGHTVLEEKYLSISYEHEESPSDGYFLTIEAPLPGRPRGQSSWSVAISKWVPDEFDSDGEVESAHGETVLECALAARPTADELAGLLGMAGSGPEQLPTWAKTPVGDALAGTAVVVTTQHDDSL